MKKILITSLLLGMVAAAGAVDVGPLGSLAILEGGRKKPLDTFARECLLKMVGRSTWQRAADDRWTALEVVTDMLFGTNQWEQASILRCSFNPLKQRLGLPNDRQYFTSSELMQNAELQRLIAEISNRESRGEKNDRIENEAINLWNKLQLLSELASGQAVRIVPLPPGTPGAWLPLANAGKAYSTNAAPLKAAVAAVQQAYRQDDPAAFAQAAARLKTTLRQLSPANYPSDDVLDRELLYNRVHPFRWAWIVFMAAFFVMLAATRERGWRRMSYWLSMLLFAVGLALQIFGFALRCWIAGRPPVTNMYEVMIWCAFGASLIAFVFELVYRSRYFALSASAVGVLSLILADNLPAVLNPAIQPLVPVLQSNYWLTIHVLTITLGYAAFMLALGIGHIAMGYYVFKPREEAKLNQLTWFNYRTMQVGVLLLTAGTILGGLWADKAWGRFWGWDPKETWALIALLCYLVVLHGRYAGWMGDFALNAASVLCFQAIIMAAYGVNYVLGKGLHSYGFGVGGEWAVASYVSLELILVAMAVWRYKLQQSHAGAGNLRGVQLQEE
jgi:ABC-type transport system involved in cytochrome c biogenesis permease subunit